MRRFWVWLAVQVFESELPPNDPDWEHPPKSAEEIVREQVRESRFHHEPDRRPAA